MLEIDRPLKRRLYAELALDGLTLKGWFIRQAEEYLRHARQPALFVAEPQSTYNADEEGV